MYGRAFVLLCLAIYVNCASPSAQNVCKTDVCASEAKNLLDYMDQTVKPCDDFYAFVCGKYIRDTKLPKDKSVDLSFFKLGDKLREQIQAALLEKSQPNELHAFKLAKDLMKTCMDEKTLNATGIKPMVEYLEKYGGWPVTKGNKWNDKNWNWLKAKREIFNDGLLDDLILEFSIGPDNKNTSKRAISVSKTDEFE